MQAAETVSGNAAAQDFFVCTIIFDFNILFHSYWRRCFISIILTIFLSVIISVVSVLYATALPPPDPEIKEDSIGGNATSLLGCYDPSVTRRVSVAYTSSNSAQISNVELYKMKKSDLRIKSISLNARYYGFQGYGIDSNIPVNYWKGNNPVYVASQGTLLYQIIAVDQLPSCFLEFYLFKESKDYLDFLNSNDSNPANFLKKSGCLPDNQSISFNFTLPTQGFYFVALHIKEQVHRVVIVKIEGSFTSYNILDMLQPECSLTILYNNCTIDINEKILESSRKQVCILAKSLMEETAMVSITQENADWNVLSTVATMILLTACFIFGSSCTIVIVKQKLKKIKCAVKRDKRKRMYLCVTLYS